jgi:hypothetical protein
MVTDRTIEALFTVLIMEDSGACIYLFRAPMVEDEPIKILTY